MPEDYSTENPDSPPDSIDPMAGARTPASILRELRDAPPTVSVSTGIAELDRLCGGGLTVPRRVILVGMPSAWKTGLALYLANQAERAGLCVGVLAIDEEPDTAAIRVAQMAGFDRAKVLQQDRAELDDAIDGLGDTCMIFYDQEHTIESAAFDLHKRARALDRHAVLVIDSLQTARSQRLEHKESPSQRDTVEANVAALRWVTGTYRMLGIATSEANRAAYREGAASMQSGMAAGAESRSIEFSAETLIVLRADDAEADTLFHVEVAKNRGKLKGSFSFRLDREHHTITEVAGGQLKEERNEAKRAERREATHADAIAVAQELNKVPGLTTRGLYDALRGRHGAFADARANRALDALGEGVERRDGPNRSKAHYLNAAKLPAFVLEALPELTPAVKRAA